MKHILTLLSLVLTCSSSLAAPYTPQDDNEVLLQLPAQPAQAELKALNEQLRSTNQPRPVLRALLRKYIELGRAQGDPRYYGYAEALIRRHTVQVESDAQLLTLWADVLQHRHDFDGALQRLDQALKRHQDLPQAQLMRAVIYRSRGEYDAALLACQALGRRVHVLVSAGCLAEIRSLTGQLAASRRLLREALSHDRRSSPGELHWAWTLLAEMALREGDARQAEQALRQALTLDPDHLYTLGLYSDLLLAQDRSGEVIALLSKYDDVDSLLLRLALAARQHGAAKAEDYRKQLVQRYAASQRRGDSAHLRYQARYLLDIAEHAEPALQAALRNWQTQKEPADARILLRAALAAGDSGAVDIVRQWVARTRLEDQTLQALLQQHQGDRS